MGESGYRKYGTLDPGPALLRATVVVVILIIILLPLYLKLTETKITEIYDKSTNGYHSTEQKKEKKEEEEENEKSLDEWIAMIRAEASHTLLHKINYWDLIDRSKPWVLVPNGSFNGYFDKFVPERFRVGPWTTFSTLYFVWGNGMTVWYTYRLYQEYHWVQSREGQYYDFGTVQWYWSLFGLCWTTFVVHNVLRSPTGWGWLSFLTYTSQSYLTLWFRYLLSTLVPFFPGILSDVNEFFRLPMLGQALATFLVWNCCLMPVLYYKSLNSPEGRERFVNYATNFRMSQMHVFNLFFAVMNGVWCSPLRTIDPLHAYSGVITSYPYVMMYLTVFDRLGIHFYFVFSPRTNITLVSWVLPFFMLHGFLHFWVYIIETYGGEEYSPLEYMVGLLSSRSTIGAEL